jgi:superfamily II DNA or RNA helicase
MSSIKSSPSLVHHWPYGIVTDSNNIIPNVNTYTYKYISGYPEPREITGTLYICNGNKYILPRALASKHYSHNIINKVPLGTEIVFGKSELPINSNQEIAINAIKDKHFGIIKMPPGTGKTRIAGMIASTFGRKTLIIVPTEIVLLQTVDELVAMFPNKKIGKYYSGSPHTDGDIVVAIHLSIIPRKDTTGNLRKTMTVDGQSINRISYMSTFGTTIYDEIHTYCTREYSEIFRWSGTDRVFGLTATPEDSKHFVVAVAHAGDIIDVEQIATYIPTQLDFKLTVFTVAWSGHYVSPTYAELLNEMSRCDERNDMIVSLCEHILLDPVRVVFMFSDRRKHLFNIQEKLKTIGLHSNICVDIHELLVDSMPRDIKKHIRLIRESCAHMNAKYINDQIDIMERHANMPQYSDIRWKSHIKRMREMIEYYISIYDESSTSLLMSGASIDDQNSARRASRLILTTYPYSKVGVNIPRANTAIFMTPRKSKQIQIIGRIMRTGGDTSIMRHIYDVIDINSMVSRQYQERREIYKSQFHARITSYAI